MTTTTARTLLSIACLASFSGSLACEGFESSEYVLPDPVIQVAPPDNDDGIESCVAVIFQLVEKEDTDGHALIAEDATAVHSSPDVDAAAMQRMERAVEKFLFFSRSHEGWSETTYYWVFRY